jgi:hypothetical protein
MIIFYNKVTGDIVGTIDGRIHDEGQLKMWIGSREDNARIVVQWKPIAWYDKDGNSVPQNSKRVFTADFVPDNEQSELFEEFDKKKLRVLDYKVDLATSTIVKK